ncbi:hypothetical protein [Auraticoccus monumenti]|uniref:Uncharacterized protein n=1 Tax=Auraticoccus monumenti TaxID=675864 RepID=A0A1G6WFK1_9ACTN|nr:hypothetical protein [Auraticoccus monumenti]SDD64007.1 hypothetical protein SAMN04489747_1416 [Auraticoccus monumenti]
MNRYGTLGHGPVDRDQERLLRELQVELTDPSPTTPDPSRRPAATTRVRRALASLVHPRPSSALR